MRLPILALTAGLSLLLAACGSHDHGPVALPTPTETITDRPVNVVVSTNILGDIVSQIVQCADGGTVTVLMPPGSDPHDYSPSSDQVAAMVGADLVITNGLGLESGMAASLDGAVEDGARVYEVAPWLDPLPFGGESDSHDEEHGDHDHGDLDPHVWFDMDRMATAATQIAAEIGVLTSEPDRYTECGSRFAAEITEAEASVSGLLNSVPADRRVLVTDHEALGYLADRYDYTVAGTVIPAGTTLADPSSADLVNLATLMRDQGIDVIFANVAEPTKLADTVAAEVGSNVLVVPLFEGSLGEPGSGADTYIGMMQTNARLIAESLSR